MRGPSARPSLSDYLEEAFLIDKAFSALVDAMPSGALAI
jgi:hypothetical protein